MDLFDEIITELNLGAIEGFCPKKDIIIQAFTHPSYCPENPTDPRLGVYPESNQRLEFLGDALLGFLSANSLFHRYPQFGEGELTKARASLVREKSLAAAALALGLDRFIMLGRGIAAEGGARRSSVLADTFEALLGALYLCGATLAALEAYVTGALENSRHLINEDSGEDYKGRLQEWAQKTRDRGLSYSILEERGPDHRKEFLAAVYINNEEIGRGWGATKQEAQKLAAKTVLHNIDMVSKGAEVNGDKKFRGAEVNGVKKFKDAEDNGDKKFKGAKNTNGGL